MIHTLFTCFAHHLCYTYRTCYIFSYAFFIYQFYYYVSETKESEFYVSNCFEKTRRYRLHQSIFDKETFSCREPYAFLVFDNSIYSRDSTLYYFTSFFFLKIYSYRTILIFIYVEYYTSCVFWYYCIYSI